MSRTAFSRAITRQPGANVGDGLTTAGLGQPDFDLMLAQHAAYIDALEALGVEVLQLPADDAFPDGCFVEDVAIVMPDFAIVTRPGAPSRRGESTAIEPLLAQEREIARIEAPGCVDGGDIVVAGGRVLIGLSERTNTEGARQLAAILAARGVRTQTIPVLAGLHLKSFVSYLGDDRLLLTARYAACAELAGFEHVLVAVNEEYAANCIAWGDQLLFPAGFPRTEERLAASGFVIHPLAMSEFRKMDGGLSCLSLRFDG